MIFNVVVRDCEKLKLPDCPRTAFVSFKYNPDVVQYFRNLPYRAYLPETKEWEVPMDKLTDIRAKFSNEIDFHVRGTAILRKEDKKPPKDFQYKTKPFDHQEISMWFGLNHSAWFLGDEQGLGKTKQIIDIAIARKIGYGYKHCLIVCGVNTLKWNWVREIQIHSDERSWILGQIQQKNGTIKIGSTKDKVNDLDNIAELPYFIITNIESFRDEQFATKVKDLCKNNVINMCALDEAHKCKNPQAAQTKGFLKCQPEVRIAMTGTPLMNSPLDLFVILKWLGYETHSFYQFKQYHCIMGGYGGYEVLGYKHMDELTERLDDIMLRRLKEDVFDLPEKTYVDEIIEMTPKQAVIYKEVENAIKSQIDIAEISVDPLASLIRLRQATGYTGILSTKIQESAKLDRMVDIVEEATSGGQKCIIFSNWTQMTDIIYDRLKKDYQCVVITGDTKDNQRQMNVDEFQNGDAKVIIGTIGAMGTGLTLTAGTVVIFVDEPWNKALFDQAVDRAHRIGTVSNVTVYSLMCKGTIDERIHDLIYKKGQMSDAIIDHKVDMSKQEIFDYLLG